MRIWCVPMQCLDNRRLLAQHNECHICFNVITRYQAGEKRVGWATTPQALPFHGRRGALVEYHDRFVVPEMVRRGWTGHRSPLPSPVVSYEAARFWDCVTWDMVLRDCRHLLEKWSNDHIKVDQAQQMGVKTRIIRPQGQNEELTRKVLHVAVCHVHGISINDLQGQRLKAEELLSQPLLDRPIFKPRRRRRRVRV